MSTPVRQQYLRIKREHPDTILFFRMGDFYETFDDDARVVSGELDIVLTAREIRGRKIPMAGVPFHAAESYLAKLVSRGHKVAICEQMTEPNGKDLVERRVVRVLTPGTVDEPSMVEASRNNYLAAMIAGRRQVGIAYVDITTGEFAATQIDGPGAAERAVEELVRLGPAEVIYPEPASSTEDSLEASLLIQSPAIAAHTGTPMWRWKTDAATQAILEHTGASTLDAFGLESWPYAARAAGALLQYLEEVHSNALQGLAHPRSYSTAHYMPLDDRTRRNLELTESMQGDRAMSLYSVLDHTVTPMGGRTLRRWITQPLLSKDALEERLDRVEAFVRRSDVRSVLRDNLRDVADLERLARRAMQGVIGPRELRTLGTSLHMLPRLRERLAEIEPSWASRLHTFPDLEDLVLSALVDDPPTQLGQASAIREGYSRELDNLRGASTEARRWIASLERSERERTGIRGLKVGYNKVFGYYIEVTNSAKDQVPAEYIRKQTLVGAERYITSELKEYESLILHSQEQAQELEEALYRQIIGQVAGSSGPLGSTAVLLAELDALLSLAEASLRNGYVRPELAETAELDIVGGRHPVIEQRFSGEFVPNDCHMDAGDDQILVITGPNMAGKSTFLRQVALIVLMAQIGCFVPATASRIGIADRIFTRVGAQDDIASGQSTFMVEMAETAFILGHCTRRSLLVLDEIGRGTSTYDGLAIAQSVVEYIHNSPKVGARTLFATHYHELNALAAVLPRVRNFRMDVLEDGDQVVFLRKVVPGGADRSYGVHVARLAGLPRAVVRRAQELLQGLEAAPAAETARPEEQLTFLSPDDGLLREVAEMDVESMTPVEALTKLFELKTRAANKLVEG